MKSIFDRFILSNMFNNDPAERINFVSVQIYLVIVLTIKRGQLENLSIRESCDYK